MKQQKNQKRTDYYNTMAQMTKENDPQEQLENGFSFSIAE